MGTAVTAGVPLGFRYLMRETRVATPSATYAQWLRECLEPHFSVNTAKAADWIVTFAADPEGYRALASQRRAADDEIPFFTLDSRLVALPRWNGGRAGELVGFDAEFEVFYTVRQESREVDVLATDLRPWGRVALLRVVRELAMEEAIAAGGVFLHAAAFERDGMAYVIAGPKNAGKTTLLIHALTSGASRFVSNDRVLLMRSAHGHDVRGMPTLVNVRAGTRGCFARHFDPHGFGPDSGCLTLAEHRAGHYPAAREDEPMILNPRQFTESLDVASSVGGRLGAILFPVVSAQHEGIEITELL